jgi:hypothetical protein
MLWSIDLLCFLLCLWYCTLYRTVLYCTDYFIQANGVQSLKQHAATPTHTTTANARKGRERGQGRIVVMAAADPEVGGNPDANANNAVPVLNTAANLPQTTWKLDDRVTKAEILLSLHAVQYCHSYKSFDTLVPLLQKADPDSKIFGSIKLGHSKVSSLVSHALHPHFHDILVKSVKASPAFSLGTDAATFNHLGLSKHVDLKLR